MLFLFLTKYVEFRKFIFLIEPTRASKFFIFGLLIVSSGFINAQGGHTLPHLSIYRNSDKGYY